MPWGKRSVLLVSFVQTLDKLMENYAILHEVVAEIICKDFKLLINTQKNIENQLPKFIEHATADVHIEALWK
jgi:hypothetical protein